MMNIGYYQGILQLRNIDKELVSFVKKYFKKNGVNIAKEVKLSNGWDYYVDSNKHLLRLGKELVKRFNGELKTSKKLHTQDRLSGKKIYRVTLLFRMSKLRVGDVIEYKGKKVKIKNLGKKISAIYLDNGKRVSFNYLKV